MSRIASLLSIFVCLGISSAFAQSRPATSSAPADAPLIEPCLLKGDLAAAQRAVELALQQHDDPNLQFQLGATQFLRSVESLAQSLYRFGFLPDRQALSLFGSEMLPIRLNPRPVTAKYDDIRAIARHWLEDLSRAEATLAKIADRDVHMPLRFGLIRLDLNADGRCRANETLWKIYAQLNRASGVTAEEAQAFVIDFDTADVYWLRGYCHLLMAMTEAVLAYDEHDLFDRTGQIFFAQVNSPYQFVNGRSVWGYGRTDIADAVGFIHLINFPLVDAAGMKRSLGHLQEMSRLSRKMWQAVSAEKDNSREWIPAPKQKGVIPGIVVSDQMIKGWHGFLDELDQILAGKKLIPFWRGDEELGVNLNKFFNAPEAFDLVLWIQGSAAKSYVEKGQITDPAVWRGLQNLFEGEFIGFAFWFN